MKRRIKKIINNYPEIIFYIIVIVIIMINNKITEYKHNQEVVDISNMYIEDYNNAINSTNNAFITLNYSLQLNMKLRNSFLQYMDSNDRKIYNQYADSIKFYGDSAVFYSYKIN